MGLSTRTGKINNYKVPYEVRPPPKDWHYFVRDKDGKPTKVEVKYTKNGELVQDKLSAREIKDFIFRYRENEERPGSRLKLWIQKCPTDSARRYFNKEHSKCRFSECPAVVNQTGTILHGHYRVAFDEMWLTHGKNSDPYFASMYAHLYCMERFLDFKVVCKHRNVVEVDSRELLQEPKGRWAASLHAQPESTIARDFVKLCRGEISYMDEFENYPVHSHYKRGAGKPHENTLTYYMHEAKESTRPPAQLDQFIVERNLKRTHILVHKGNLDVMFSEIKKRKERRAKRAKKARRAKRKKRANDNEDDESNTDNEEEDPLITSILEKIASARAHASKNKRKKRMPRVRDSDVAESEEESEEEEFNNPDGNDSDEETIVVSHTPSQGSRSSARIARQVQAHGPKHYAVDAHDVLQEERIETSHTRKRPEEESTEIKDMHKAKRIKLVSSKEASQVEAVRPANKRAHSPTVEKSGESQFLRPNKRQRTFESPGSRLSLDSNGLPRLPDFRAYPSTDTCNEDTPIQRFGKAQPELPSEEAGQGLDFGEFDYLFTDLERRQSSFSDAGRRRSRGLSLLKSTGAPRIARVASVTFAEKHSTREFREDDPPRTSPVEYSQVNQGPRRSGRTNKAIQSSAKPTGIQKKGEKGVSKKRRTKQK
jgi:hypothetical protein